MSRMTGWLRAHMSWSEGAKARGKRALCMLEDMESVTRVNPGHYSVKSQSQPELWCDVRLGEGNRWACSCPDHKYRKAQCKHILAVTAESADSGAAAALGVDGGRGAAACSDGEAEAREEGREGGPHRPGPPVQAASDDVAGVQ